MVQFYTIRRITDSMTTEARLLYAGRVGVDDVDGVVLGVKGVCLISFVMLGFYGSVCLIHTFIAWLYI